MENDSKKAAKVEYDSKDDLRSSGHLDEFDEHEAKKIIRRIDRRLVVTVGAMYCVSLMDRTNLSSAAIAGLNTELFLIGDRYSIITLVFFVTYTLFQPPSTVVCRKIGPRLHLSVITFAWGIVMIGFGFVQNWEVLIGLRLILGLFEAGFFPSAVYLLSTWYTRYEVGKRYSFFYILGSVSSGFSGILAYGLVQLNGRQGLTGWRWIFIVEGSITAALGIAAYWLLVDFPDSHRKTWNFLSDKERAWIVRRVQADRGDAITPKFHLGMFLRGGTDYRLWLYALIFFGTTTVSYSLAFFLPIILNENLGFDRGISQVLVAPPYAFAGFYMFLMGYLGDKFRLRGPIILCNMTVCLIGLPLLGWGPSNGAKYLGTFFIAAGANSNVPSTLSFQANNIRGQWKRAFASATLVGFGGIGGIAGSLVFRNQDKPTGYKPGLYACIVVSVVNIILVIICDITFYFDNKKADRGEKELEADDDEFQPGFRYTY